MEKLAKLYEEFLNRDKNVDRLDYTYLDNLFQKYFKFDEINIGYLDSENVYTVISFAENQEFEEHRIIELELDYWKLRLDNFEFFEEREDCFISRIYGDVKSNKLKYFIQFIMNKVEFNKIETIMSMELVKNHIFYELNNKNFKELNHLITEFEFFDNLTKIYNREKFLLDIDKLIKKQIHFSLFRIKIASLHKINSVFGNKFGDELLIVFSSRLKNILELEMYRVDGSEFVIICKTKDEEYIKDRIMESLEHPLRIKNNRLKVEAFLGLVRYPENGEDFSSIEFSSEVSVDHGKMLGLNKIGIFNKEFMNKKKLESKISEALPKAIENRNFELFYQAQLSINEKRPVGLEALLRWKLDGEYVSPGLFIPIAEKNGYILDIGYLVFEEACKYQRRLSSCNFNLSVAVNVSVRQLLDDDFIRRISEIINKTGADVSKIDLEITETMSIEKDNFIDYKIIKLKEIGFKIVIDDFGTGYSSLDYLRNGMFDKLKIDREFIKNIQTEYENSVDKILLVSIIDLANGVGMPVVVEGVETQEQVKFLESTKCEIVQGFVYSNPINGDSMLNYLSSYVSKEN